MEEGTGAEETNQKAILMIRSLYRITFFALLACGAAESQEKVSDVEGWSTTKWGMTEAEILQACPESEIAPGAPWLPKGVNVGIRAYSIQGTDYEVTFLLDKSGRLDRVQITPQTIKGPQGLPVSPPVMERLEALLVDKYGPPTASSEETKAGLTTTVRSWVFPHTTIELRRINELRFGFGGTFLTYRKNSAAGKI